MGELGIGEEEFVEDNGVSQLGKGGKHGWIYSMG